MVSSRSKTISRRPVAPEKSHIPADPRADQGDRRLGWAEELIMDAHEAAFMPGNKDRRWKGVWGSGVRHRWSIMSIASGVRFSLVFDFFFLVFLELGQRQKRRHPNGYMLTG
jgi:hypothetical protein